MNAKDNIAHLGREERRKDPLREDVGEEAGLGSDISNFKDSSNDFKSSQQIVLMIRTMRNVTIMMVNLFKEFLDMAEARPDSLKSNHSVLELESDN